jgi:hypothetical protein
MFHRYLFSLIFVGSILGSSLHVWAGDYRDLDPKARNSNLQIKTVKAKGISLVSDSLGRAPHSIAGISNNTVEHWWIEIETQDPNIWYLLQFGGKHSNNKKYLELQSCTSKAEVDRRGNIATNGNDLFVIKSRQPSERLTIGQIYAWASTFDSTYSVMSNNCQDVVNEFWTHFFNTRAHNPVNDTVEGVAAFTGVPGAAIVGVAVSACEIQ